MKFQIKRKERPSKRDKPMIKILISPVVMASGISTMCLPSGPNELWDKLK